MSRWLVAALVVLAPAAMSSSATGLARSQDIVIVLTAPDPPAPPSTVIDNAFLPDRDLDECISALPQPECGSKDRGGWRQMAIFGLVVVAIAFIAWRIIRSARRPERTTTDDT